MDKINNKNAREKALLEEAYGNVYNESPIQHKFSKKYRDKVEDEFKDHIKLRNREGTLGAKYPPGEKYKDEIQKKIDQGWKIEDEQNPDAGEYGPHGEGERPGPEEELNPYIEEEEGSTDIKDILDDIWDVMEDDSSDDWWEKLDGIVRRHADQEFWDRKQEDMKYSAEPTGYHEW
jgi:hypothetical protein